METSELYNLTALFIDNIHRTWKVLRDGKVSLSELPDLLSIGSNTLTISKQIGRVSGELTKLNKSEFKHLKEYIVTETDIDDDHAEAVIETAMITALTFYRLLKKGNSDG